VKGAGSIVPARARGGCTKRNAARRHELASAFMVVGALWLSGCERAMHDMYEQPKYKPGAPSSLFPDGSSARTPPEGSLPTSSRSSTSQSLASASASASASAFASVRPATSPALLVRGRERFDIYCAPCHGLSGDGGGMVVRRGFPAPPSYHTDNLRKVPDVHIYDVISNGYGVMYPYADRIVPEDRWAIVAYVRALQLSQHAPRDRLAPKDLIRLDAAVDKETR